VTVWLKEKVPAAGLKYTATTFNALPLKTMICKEIQSTQNKWKYSEACAKNILAGS